MFQQYFSYIFNRPFARTVVYAVSHLKQKWKTVFGHKERNYSKQRPEPITFGLEAWTLYLAMQLAKWTTLHIERPSNRVICLVLNLVFLTKTICLNLWAFLSLPDILSTLSVFGLARFYCTWKSFLTHVIDREVYTALQKFFVKFKNTFKVKDLDVT